MHGIIDLLGSCNRKPSATLGPFNHSLSIFHRLNLCSVSLMGLFFVRFPHLLGLILNGHYPNSFKYALIKSSMSPSITAATLPVSTFVLVSFTRRIGLKYIIAYLTSPCNLFFLPAQSFQAFSRSVTSISYIFDLKHLISMSSLFCTWLLWFWQETTIPVGKCVIRTAESVLLTCCPPAPEERYVSTRTSSGFISMMMSSSISGETSTEAKLVCLFALLSKGDIRTSRWTPFSDFA